MKSAQALEKDELESGEEEENNLLDISDEEFDKILLDDLSKEEENSSDSDAGTDDNKDEDNKGEEGDKDNTSTSDNDNDTTDDNDNTDTETSSDKDETSGDEEGDDTSSKAQPFQGNKNKTEEKDEDKNEDEDEDETDGDKEDENQETSEKGSIDFETEYKKLLAPFRANNKNMQVDSVDDARTLMQMGANYNKKMAGLKPSLKIIKMLDNNGLLDEEKLSFLIDLDKKNPEAISKLIKDSGINPLEIDVETDSKYKSNTYTVNDKEVELDQVLEDIKDTPSFNETVDIIGNKWDESSKNVLSRNPGIIKLINEHIELGIFKQIQGVIERDRALGKLNGVSDLEAYKQVGDSIKAEGGFDNLINSKQNTNTNTVNKDSTNVSKKKTNKAKDSKLRDRKKAAGLTKATPSKKGITDFDPLSMSDEEIEKIASSKFI